MDLFIKILLALSLLVWVGADLLLSPSPNRLKVRIITFLTLFVVSGVIYWAIQWFS
ncbi:hypothetical protein [Brevibacillus sp. AY1]|uniref:hypothetical protein n=1 Tax=Brevibacillus sp. AY1 TaxID=2807621 RepID=UPI002454B6D2|nr:hypothetical protein [Brevibacillus sp. AY1]MDH4617617.1 hypothetical protein [Brevibacillus sp. AY1]